MEETVITTHLYKKIIIITKEATEWHLLINWEARFECAPIWILRSNAKILKSGK